MMIIIYNLFIFFSLNVFLVNLLYLKKKKNISITEFYSIFIWHFLFSIIYFFYVAIFGGDTNGFLEYAKNFREIQGTRPFILGNGSSFIYNLVSIFHNKLKLDLINIISIFNFIGFVGLIYFFLTLKNISKSIDSKNLFIKNLPYLIIFIPSLSFWTSGIGKEPFTFLSISLFLYSIHKQKCNYFLIVISFIILFITRWQFSIIMLLSCFVIFQIKDITKYAKNKKILILLSLSFVAFNLLTDYLFNFHIFKLDPLINAILERKNTNEFGTLNTNFNVNLIQIILNYLFSPIQFKSVLFSITAIENIYLISLIFLLILNFKIKNLKYINLAILIFIISFLISIPFATFNIGIAMRQKWIVLAVIFVFLASGLKTYKKNKV